MASHFIWGEIILYLLPPCYIYFFIHFGKNYLRRFSYFPVTIAMCLIPVWLILIKIFSLLIYSFSILPHLLFILVFLLACHLYIYIQGIRTFSLLAYWQEASKLVFAGLSASLLSLMILRFFTW